MQPSFCLETLWGHCQLLAWRRLFLCILFMTLKALSFLFLLSSSGAGTMLMVLLFSSLSHLEPGCLRLLLLIVLEEFFFPRKKILSLLVLIYSLFCILCLHMFFYFCLLHCWHDNERLRRGMKSIFPQYDLISKQSIGKHCNA